MCKHFYVTRGKAALGRKTAEGADAAAEIGAEIEMLASSSVDALCAGSAEELRALARAAEGAGATLPSVLVCLGDETAACARDECAAAGGGLPADATVLALGSRVAEAQVVEALEAHFGAGRLLW